eukprot:Hpha_TRINITY_DN14963_c0_g1::TRINITY_DN14963_c0_g1_i1::g.143453::m.143453
MRAMFGIAFVLPLAAACDLTFHNTLSKPVTVCTRENGGVPGAGGKVQVEAGKSVSTPCKIVNASQSWVSYFSVLDWADCGYDTCAPPLQNTGTCQHYPYSMGQGAAAGSKNWYGSIGYNNDGAGQGWTGGNYSTVGYGIELTCTAYGTQAIDDKCGPTGCTPNKPSYNRPNSGVVACDTDKAITVTIVAA